MTKTSELYLRVPADLLTGPASGMTSLQGRPPIAFLITGIAGSSAGPESLRAFIAWARSQNVAVLIENDARLAKELDADGVHLRAHSQPLKDVRTLLGSEKAIGVSCTLSRDEAMQMAEDGADYIAFGEVGADDPGEVAAMIRWWDEIFEVPCVAWVRDQHDEQALGALVAAGADYLALPGRCAIVSGVLEICAELGRAGGDDG